MRTRAKAWATLLACTIALVACGGHATGESGSGGKAAYSSGAGAVAARSIPSGDWSQFNYTAQRGGAGPPNTGITPGDLRLLQRRTVRLDGTVDSTAIELHAIKVRGRRRDVLVLTTTYGRTIALDAGTGRKLWEFVPADIRAYEGSAQITTATPTADPNRRYVYATSPDARVHKLALSSGREVRSGHWPVSVSSDPSREKLASPPSLVAGALIIVTDGYNGDAPTYQGHVVKIDRVSGRIEAVWNSLCSNRHRLINPPSSCPASDSAIWGRAGAVIEPGSGRILVSTGNGQFNGSTDWGDSVLELSSGLRLLHNWTPSNQASLNARDADLGSTSPVLLAAGGAGRFAVQGGKSGVLSLLNLNRLDGTTGGAGPRTGGELQTIQAPRGDQVFTAPAVWKHGGRVYLFVADNSGTAAYTFGAGQRLGVLWQDGTPGTSPVIAGGLLYVYDQVHGALVVRRPTSAAPLAALPAAPGHWNSPIAVGGRIVLPEGDANAHATSGMLEIYHLPGR
ncbi:MAG: PQQ-binding-like beta-propeller repeat protein [Actinomycetota bacterium]|nr:PQQ-binding-like beta-propeller repeat protein [Actinomycetota bacterium]